jgi:CRP/FNR family transcriptional regulator, cyclic AMP receptor protein
MPRPVEPNDPRQDTTNTPIDSPADGEHGPLSHVPLFAGLAAEEQQELCAAMKLETVEANQTIFWRGDLGDSLYLVSAGQVAVTVPNEQGEHVTLDHLGPGGFFGEISLLDGGPRTATVRTTQRSELYVLMRDDFHAIIRKRPHVAIEILTIMGCRQRVSTEAIRGLKNPNVAFERTRVGPWQRVSDVIAAVAASQWFTMFHLAWFGGWIGLNLLASLSILPSSLAFDPFPFGLLTMVVSLEAIFLSIFVMVSQNRQSEKDRLRIDLDYQVNVKAHTEITALARKIERLETHLLGESLERELRRRSTGGDEGREQR